MRLATPGKLLVDRMAEGLDDWEKSKRSDRSLTVASEDKGLALDFETGGFGGVPTARTERDDEGALCSEEARDVESDWGGPDPGVDAREIRLRLSSNSWVSSSETLESK